jgi:hypothetical protein
MLVIASESSPESAFSAVAASALMGWTDLNIE